MSFGNRLREFLHQEKATFIHKNTVASDGCRESKAHMCMKADAPETLTVLELDTGKSGAIVNIIICVCARIHGRIGNCDPPQC